MRDRYQSGEMEVAAYKDPSPKGGGGGMATTVEERGDHKSVEVEKLTQWLKGTQIFDIDPLPLPDIIRELRGEGGKLTLSVDQPRTSVVHQNLSFGSDLRFWSNSVWRGMGMVAPVSAEDKQINNIIPALQRPKIFGEILFVSVAVGVVHTMNLKDSTR
jgi:hypothetical protein